MYISLTIYKIISLNSAKMAKATYQMLRRVKNEENVKEVNSCDPI